MRRLSGSHSQGDVAQGRIRAQQAGHLVATPPRDGPFLSKTTSIQEHDISHRLVLALGVHENLVSDMEINILPAIQESLCFVA